MPRIPTFGLLTTRMDGWYQSQAWHGATNAGKLLGVRVVALVGSGFGDPHLRGGHTEAYSLAANESIDGYLVLSSALANFSGPGAVRDFMAGLPPKPTVSIGMELPGAGAILSDGGGMDAVARHLVQAHGLDRMAYIGGPPTNGDARRRWDDWTRTLAEMGLEQDPLLVETGDFLPTSGETAAERILSRAATPQAFVCANDAMALGVRRTLAAHRLRVPRDVILVGYDDIDECQTLLPPLTTVSASVFQTAFRGIDTLLRMWRGAAPSVEIVPTRLQPRRSCGCHAGPSSAFSTGDFASSPGATTSVTDIVDRLVREEDPPSLFDDILETADYAELDALEEALQAAAGSESSASTRLVAAQAAVSRARHGLDSRRRQSLQTLMRTQFHAIHSLTREMPLRELGPELLRHLAPFAENWLRILLFREDCSPLPAGPVPAGFEMCIDTRRGTITRPEAGRILPEGDDPAGTWVVLPLSLGAERYGVVELRDWNSNEPFLESLCLSLTLVFSGFQKTVRETAVREELRRLSLRDELTGLLNRRGLIEQGSVLVQVARRTGKRIGLVLCDLDGLKEINDVHGHQDGDKAIRCLSRALTDSFRKSDVVARLGGDEFAVVSIIDPGESLDPAVARLHEALALRSEEIDRPWNARTSVGWASWEPEDCQCLDQLLAQADRELYADKRLRKARLVDG